MEFREGIGWWITLLLLIPINAGHRLSLKDIRKHYYGDQDVEISEEYRALQNDIRRELAGLDPTLLKHFYVDSEECEEVNCLGHSFEEEDDEREGSEEVTERSTMRPKNKKATRKLKREEVAQQEVTTTSTGKSSTTTQEPTTTTLKTTTTKTTPVTTTRTTTTPTTSTTIPSTTQTTTTTSTTTTTTTPKPTTTTTSTTPTPTTTTTKTTPKPSTTRLITTTSTTTTKPPATTTTTTTSTTEVPSTTAYLPPNTTVHIATIEPFQFFVQQSSEEHPVRPVIIPATPSPKYIPIINPTALSLPKSAVNSNDVLARIYNKLHKLKLLKHHRQKADAGRKKPGSRSKTALDQTALLNKLALDENQFATVGEIVVKFPGHQPPAQKSGASRKPRHQPNPSRNRLRRQDSGRKRMQEEKKKARKLKKLLKEAQRKFKKESKKKKRGLN